MKVSHCKLVFRQSCQVNGCTYASVYGGFGKSPAANEIVFLSIASWHPSVFSPCVMSVSVQLERSSIRTWNPSSEMSHRECEHGDLLTMRSFRQEGRFTCAYVALPLFFLLFLVVSCVYHSQHAECQEIYLFHLVKTFVEQDLSCQWRFHASDIARFSERSMSSSPRRNWISCRWRDSQVDSLVIIYRFDVFETSTFFLIVAPMCSGNICVPVSCSRKVSHLTV